MNGINERIRKAREKKGLLQKELAELLNVNRVTITNIENGKNKGNFDILKKLCDALEVTPNYIILGQEKGNETSNELTPNINSEGMRLYKEYIKYLEKEYPEDEITKIGNL